MADISETRIYEALGLSAPNTLGAEGGQAQEPAAPADTQAQSGSAAEGAQGQEVAAPAQAEPEGAKEGAHQEPDADGGGTEGGDDGSMPPEQRRANAARRRQKEQQEAVNAAVEAALEAERNKANAQMQAFFAKAGLKDTFTGESITNMEQFEQWSRKFEQAKLEQDLKKGKLTPESLATAIGNHPVMQQAAQAMQQQEQQRRQQEREVDQARIQTEIQEIGKLDASIKTVQDLLNMPRAKEFYDFVGKGYSFLDAYRLANFDALTARTAEAAKQQALNNARGKDHLNATGNPRGEGAMQVPAKDMAMFRMFNPNATEAEIQVYYNKYKKQGG